MQLNEIFNWINSTSKAEDSDFIRRALVLVAIHHAAKLPNAIEQAEQIREKSKSQLPINKKSSESLVNQVISDELPKPLSGLPSQLFERLGNIATINKGLTPIQKATPGAYPLVVTAKDRLTSSTYNFDTPAAIIPTVSSTGHGDASLKRIHYQEGKYAVGSILAVLQPKLPELISARFIYEYLSVFKDDLLVSRMVGTANVSLTINKIMEVPIPLVSGSIIDELPELMALCDHLEQQHSNAQEAHETLVSQLLATLTQSQNAAEFNANWQRIYAHFDVLFTTEASIDALKQTLLQLAVMGKLVPQDPNDEPASSFYSREIKLPDSYERSGKQKIKENNHSSIDLLPSIPSCWTYKNIDDLYKNKHILDYADGNHGSLYPRSSEFSDDGVIFLTAAQITKNNEISWADCARLNHIKAKELSKGWANEGDVFFTHNATVGRTAFAEKCPESPFLLGTSVTYYRINNNSVYPRYLLHYFSSLSWQLQAEAVMQQTTRNQVSITKQALFYVALPPKNEQIRISTKLDTLMILCDQLKTRIQQANQQQQTIADALVAQAVA